MHTHTVWLVPHQQEICVSALWDIAESLWDKGFSPYLDLEEKWSDPGCQKTPQRRYDYFPNRELDWIAAGRTLPQKVSGPFESTWITCRSYKFLIPTFDDSLVFYCPRCQRKILPRNNSTAGGDFWWTYGAFVSCTGCGNSFPATELISDLSRSAWAQFCVSFTGYTYDEPVDEWVETVTGVIGPSYKFLGWHG